VPSVVALLLTMVEAIERGDAVWTAGHSNTGRAGEREVAKTGHVHCAVGSRNGPRELPCKHWCEQAMLLWMEHEGCQRSG